MNPEAESYKEGVYVENVSWKVHQSLILEIKLSSLISEPLLGDG